MPNLATLHEHQMKLWDTFAYIVPVYGPFGP
jgi:hypothetical protein